MDKSPAAFRTISEVAQDLALPQHVLRFWETRFTQIKPLKRGGGRRYYRPDDIELLRSIRHLLYADGYTIKGVQRLLREHGVKAVAAAASGNELQQATMRRLAEVADAEPPDADTARTMDEHEDRQEGELAAPFDTAPAARTGQRPAEASLDRHKLQAILAELVECERLLAAARSV